MDANCQVCGRPVHVSKKGQLVHVEPLGQMVVTEVEAARVRENARRNSQRLPHDRIYGLILHRPIRETE